MLPYRPQFRFYMTLQITQNIYNLYEKRLRPWSRKKVGQRRAMGKLRELDNIMKESMRFSYLSSRMYPRCPSAYYRRIDVLPFSRSETQSNEGLHLFRWYNNALTRTLILSIAFGSSRCINKMEKAPSTSSSPSIVLIYYSDMVVMRDMYRHPFGTAADSITIIALDGSSPKAR